MYNNYSGFARAVLLDSCPTLLPAYVIIRPSAHSEKVPGVFENLLLIAEALTPAEVRSVAFYIKKSPVPSAAVPESHCLHPRNCCANGTRGRFRNCGFFRRPSWEDGRHRALVENQAGFFGSPCQKPS